MHGYLFKSLKVNVCGDVQIIDQKIEKYEQKALLFIMQKAKEKGGNGKKNGVKNSERKL